MNQPRFVSRKQALRWLGAPERTHNYVLEQDLDARYNRQHCIKEFCPRDRWFCQWEKYAPIRDIKVLYCEMHIEGIWADHVFEEMKRAIKQRTT